MLATEKIAKSFVAIVDEAEKLLAKEIPEEVATGLKTIISIARHQSDIRDSRSGTCTSSSSKKH